MSSASGERLVTPGQVVGDADRYDAGCGVFASGGQLLATVAGTLSTTLPETKAKDGHEMKQENQTETETAENGNKNDRKKPVIQVTTAGPSSHSGVPSVGSVIRLRVARVTARAAHGDVLLVDGVGARDGFKVMIRQQDVRQTEVDKVEMYACFMPGDVVVAKVISTGDKNYYYASTASNEFGVVYARNKATNVPMVPINWQQMQCPVSKMKELRKVAKVH